MTYITYIKKQYSDYKQKQKIGANSECGLLHDIEVYKVESIYRHSKPPKKIPSVLPKPDFMPTYLVRISDMKVVPGSELNEGYCTLSYSWSQSGEMIKDETGEKSHRRIDEGKHKIVYPARTVRKKPRGRKRIPRKVKYVKFEGLIQEICKDFNIKYIWYDQMCINQGDADEKHREIRQMHKIYSNAYCKIALVPELNAVTRYYEHHDKCLTYISLWSLLEAQWMKRMWTLEELVMSSKILFVGSDTHCWWYCIPEDDSSLFQHDSNREVPKILYSAHARTSTKEHDHVFALANIFPDVMNEITIDYNQDIQQLMIQFYGALAKRDLTILCFRSHDDYPVICQTPYTGGTIDNNIDEGNYKVPIQQFDLPSWTGVNGEHLLQNHYRTSFKNYAIDGRVMKVRCSGMTNNHHATDLSFLESMTSEDIPPLPQVKAEEHCDWVLALVIRTPDSKNDKFISLYVTSREEGRLYPRVEEIDIENLKQLSHFISIKENFQWISTKSQTSFTYIGFDWLTENLNDFDQYVLLNGIEFKASSVNEYEYSCYPVIKKRGDHYIMLGLCLVDWNDHYLNDIRYEEQMFEIY